MSEAKSGHEITGLLGAIRHGDQQAWDRLAALVYDRLRALARGQLRGPRAGGSLTPTILVHEAYLKLVKQRQVDWRDRQHFLAVAPTAMRQIVVDHARRKRAQRGAAALTTPWSTGRGWVSSRTRRGSTNGSPAPSSCAISAG